MPASLFSKIRISPNQALLTHLIRNADAAFVAAFSAADIGGTSEETRWIRRLEIR